MSEYNGWKNRETWCVNLHLNNDEGLYLHCHEMAQEIAGRDWYDNNERKVSTLAAELREFTADMIGEKVDIGQGDLAADILKYALRKVDWAAIAEGFLEGVE